MTRPDRIHYPVVGMAKGDLRAATRSLVAKWFAERSRTIGYPDEALRPADFGTLEPYLAEAAIVERGTDFLFLEWGAAMDVLCGGNRLGHMLSALPQPSRGYLRRVCVRAAASRSPAVSRATWVLGGDIWRCVIIALPTDVDVDFGVRRLVVALLFTPYPPLAWDRLPEGFGWPAAVLRGGVHRIGAAQPDIVRRPSNWRKMTSIVQRFFSEVRPR
jgi:hypothetical protein